MLALPLPCLYALCALVLAISRAEPLIPPVRAASPVTVDGEAVSETDSDIQTNPEFGSVAEKDLDAIVASLRPPLCYTYPAGFDERPPFALAAFKKSTNPGSCFSRSSVCV